MMTTMMMMLIDPCAHWWVSLVGQYCVRITNGLRFNSSILLVNFSNYGLFTRPDLTWSKGHGGDVISNTESLDSLPSAD